MNSTYHSFNSILFSIIIFILLSSIYLEIENYIPTFSQGFKDKSNIIRGNIIFDNNTKPFVGAVIHIYLEDISLQDAPSIPIREQVIKEVSYRPDNNKNNIPFSINGTVPDISGRYAIRVDIDVNNDGRIGDGDLITTNLYTISPKLGSGYNNKLFIEVKEINKKR